MRYIAIFTTGLFLTAAPLAAQQATPDPLAGFMPMDETQLGSQAVPLPMNGLTAVKQGNSSDIDSVNEDNTVSAGGGTLTTGGIAPLSLTDNRGSFTVMQNTGNVVNMNNSTNINVHLQ